MDIQTLEKENADLKNQNQKRNMVIGGFMVVGAVAGFLVARGFKQKALGLTLGAVGGSFLFGLPVLFATRKKAVERRKKIDENNTQIATLQNVNNAVTNLVTNVLPKSVEMTPEQKKAMQNLTTEQKKAVQNAAILATSGLPGGRVNMSKIVS